MEKEFAVNSLEDCNKDIKQVSHRDKRIDKYIGKRVTVTLIDKEILRGLLTFDEKRDRYRLSNVIDKRGMPSGDYLLRKSHIKKIEV